MICYQFGRHERGRSAGYLAEIARAVLRTGQAWISTAQIGAEPVLRACITNCRTGPKDVDALVRVLDAARQALDPPQA